MNIEHTAITGLVLAGGRGTRMGGVDKGLQPYNGLALARHALLRLQPQVGSVMLSANRNLPDYEAWGVPVWPDAAADFASPQLEPYAGPLAGLLAGLLHCQTPYLMAVPCDTPHFPADLVQRLVQGLTKAQVAQPDVAMAVTWVDGKPQPQAAFALVRTDLHRSLAAYLHGGGRKMSTWLRQQRCAEVLFSDAQAFANANTQQELQRLQPGATDA